MPTTYNYDDRTFLNRLAMHASEEECEFSATLMPDIPEFIKASDKARQFDVSSPEFADLDERLKDEQFTQDQKHAIVMLHLCEKHNILPFWSLEFDYSFRQFEEPKIIYSGYNFDGSIYGEPYKSCVDPLHFTKDSMWYSIGFRDARGEESIKRVKNSINEFIEQGYIVTKLSGRFRPYTRSSGHYFEYEDQVASMHAGNGVITFFGDIEFDPNDLVTREPDQTEEEPQKLSEKAVAYLKENNS